MKTLKLIDGIPANFFIVGLKADTGLDGAYQVMVLDDETMYLHSHRFTHYKTIMDGYGQTLPMEAKDFSEAQAVRLVKKICKSLNEGGKLDRKHWDKTDLSVLYSVANGSDKSVSISFDR